MFIREVRRVNKYGHYSLMRTASVSNEALWDWGHRTKRDDDPRPPTSARDCFPEKTYVGGGGSPGFVSRGNRVERRG